MAELTPRARRGVWLKISCQIQKLHGWELFGLSFNQVLQVQLLFTSALSSSDLKLFYKTRDQEMSKTTLFFPLEIGLDGRCKKKKREGKFVFPIWKPCCVQALHGMSTLCRYQESLNSLILWKTWSWKPVEIQIWRVYSQALFFAIPGIQNTKDNPKTMLLYLCSWGRCTCFLLLFLLHLFFFSFVNHVIFLRFIYFFNTNQRPNP